MSKKKRAKLRNKSVGKPNPATNVSAVRNRRRLIPAIITTAAIVIAVATWLGLHPSGFTSGIESSAAGQPTEVISGNNQSSDAVTGEPSIHFPETSYDFGTISQGAKFSHTFVVKNIGDEPLKLIRAKGS